jgi:hypothetical protein
MDICRRSDADDQGRNDLIKPSRVAVPIPGICSSKRARVVRVDDNKVWLSQKIPRSQAVSLPSADEKPADETLRGAYRLPRRVGKIP